MAKTVWILGAGFSKSLGGPLMPDLLSLESLRRVVVTYAKDEPIHSYLTHAPGIVQLYSSGCRDLSHLEAEERQWSHAEEFIERLDILAAYGVDEQLENFREFCRHAGAGLTKQFLSEKGPDVHELRDCAIRMLAGECCEFLNHSDTTQERWRSYKKWADALQAETDTVLTFNYDRVLEHIAYKPDPQNARGALHNMWIPSPSELEQVLAGQETPPGALVLKLHGSVDWIIFKGKICHAKDTATAFRDNGAKANIAALHCHRDQLAIATPGPTKQDMISGGKGLASLWAKAEKEIRGAQRLVFIGYKIPPTDAYTRDWFIRNLRMNQQIASSKQLQVQAVLGPDISQVDMQRLEGLLRSIHSRIHVQPMPLYGEDYLAVYNGDWS
jgi:hypothetical protein